MKRDGLVMKVVAGAAATVLAGAVMAAGSSFNAHGNRLTSLEAHREDVLSRLDRIEDKLDRLLFRSLRSSSSDRVREETAP